MRRFLPLISLSLLMLPVRAAAFDHGHEGFTEVLRRHVDEEGMVDYAALKRDPAKLDEQARIFMADASKNRVDIRGGTLYLSKIFDWFTEDFTKEGRTLAQYVAPFIADPAERRAVLTGDLRIRYTNYDWSLNEQTP